MTESANHEPQVVCPDCRRIRRKSPRCSLLYTWQSLDSDEYEILSRKDFETILCPDCLDARYKQASKGEKVPCPDWLNNDVLQRKLKGGRFIPETNATQGDLFS
jgi:hypothetical protein